MVSKYIDVSKIEYCAITEYVAKKVTEETGDGWQWDDATWILCASFIIFTMQTGKDTQCAERILSKIAKAIRRMILVGSVQNEIIFFRGSEYIMFEILHLRA